jgi:hypothetical protein
MSHTIPPLDELKRKAYCRWHNSFSHATNDCNVFCRRVQSAINEGLLSLKEMQVDKNPFVVSTIDLQNSKMMIQLEQAKGAKGKNVVINEKHTITIDEKILSREVVVEKTADGKESLKITIKAPTLGGRPKPRLQRKRQSNLKLHNQSDRFGQGAPSTTGQTDFPYWPDCPSSPWMVENFQAEESREGEVEDR